MKRIAVLASGRGSNFQAVIDRVNDGYIPGTFTALITDNPDAYAIQRAEQAGIPVKVVDFNSFEERDQYNDALLTAMKKADADLYILTGYMRLLDKKTVRTFSGKMINIHPALLPSFTGLHAQKQALDYGVKISGCTVHFVDEGMDTGQIIIQRPVRVTDSDDEFSLAERILVQEHIAMPDAVKLFCEDRIVIEDRIAGILPPGN
ncbi:MAG: phosphoribosylglycinamide formyltransferase [Euryarchaeota archaeon]|nr:phosphoribosylglycinamide formyltransferase [Euryarchaeota archaeon]